MRSEVQPTRKRVSRVIKSTLIFILFASDLSSALRQVLLRPHRAAQDGGRLGAPEAEDIHQHQGLAFGVGQFLKGGKSVCGLRILLIFPKGIIPRPRRLHWRTTCRRSTVRQSSSLTA